MVHGKFTHPHILNGDSFKLINCAHTFNHTLQYYLMQTIFFVLFASGKTNFFFSPCNKSPTTFDVLLIRFKKYGLPREKKR